MSYPARNINYEPPVGISISAFEFYDAMFDLDDLFEE